MQTTSVTTRHANSQSTSGELPVHGALGFPTSAAEVNCLEGRPLISIIVPVYDEVTTLSEVIARVEQFVRCKEVLIVDDGSTDGTTEMVRRLGQFPGVRALFHCRNLGKGAAIRTAIQSALGDVVVIQDADLEYCPSDIERLVAPILADQADVVFGSRFTLSSRSECRPLRRMANRLLTWLSNQFTGLALTDMETCYKAMRREAAHSIAIRENRFGVEPELVAKIARGKWRVIEVPIRYRARKFEAGKKIRFRDGLRAIWCIVRYSRWD